MAAYEPRAITYVTHMKCISNRHHMTTQVQQILHKCPGGFMCTCGHSPWMQPFPGWAPCGATHIAGASTRPHIIRTAIQRSALRAREINSNSVLVRTRLTEAIPWRHTNKRSRLRITCPATHCTQHATQTQSVRARARTSVRSGWVGHSG